MPKSKSNYICSSCGAIVHAWSGRCNECGEWNTLQQQENAIQSTSKANQSIQKGTILQPHTRTTSQKMSPRIKSNVGDIDNVLGGGLVPGSVVLLAGQPGIGKSTLLMQIAHSVSTLGSLLYVSGEESAEQVTMRESRLHPDDERVEIVASNSANDIAATITTRKYDVVIVDSIQTIITEDITGSPGNISQITNSAQLLMIAAKASGTCVILVGHVTKEGSIAGPKVLEHVVDVVLHLEGDRYGGFRILRSIKNRYGSTNETSILEMKDTGLAVVQNPSAALLAERRVSDGSVVVATMEGSRPLLVEVQALVNTTNYGYPKRAASGFDLNRLNLLIAMLERRTKVQLADKDVYINIVGGIKITEPAVDLAVCMAIASAAKGLRLQTDAVVFGEVGLSGEVRHVPYVDKRVGEAKKLGFKCVIGPKSNIQKNTIYKVAQTVKDILNETLKKELS